MIYETKHYRCDTCKKNIRGEKFVVWKKTIGTAVMSLPHCFKCNSVLTRIFMEEDGTLVKEIR